MTSIGIHVRRLLANLGYIPVSAAPHSSPENAAEGPELPVLSSDTRQPGPPIPDTAADPEEGIPRDEWNCFLNYQIQQTCIDIENTALFDMDEHG